MIYLTGDIHGDPQKIQDFCIENDLRQNDTIIILGDVCANYFGAGTGFRGVDRDRSVKKRLNNLGVKMLCIHGNHEMRPANVRSYKLQEWNGGKVWVEADFPNLLFAKDGEIFNLGGKRCMVIGGAYSVDKFYRLGRGYMWFADEQPSDEIKALVEQQLSDREVDVILSHTCPRKYEPVEAFLPGIDQSSVDTSTEDWLDKIEETTRYEAWYCGHWHIDKRIDKIHFLMNSFEEL